MTGSGDFAFGSTVWPGTAKLIEEAGEVLQVGGKLLQRGGNTDHWSGDLRQMLIEELGDLYAALDVFVELNMGFTGMMAIADRRASKTEVFRGWHRDNFGKPQS